MSNQLQPCSTPTNDRTLGDASDSLTTPSHPATITSRFAAPPSPRISYHPAVSPSELLHNRYQLFEPIRDGTESVYATDKRSRNPTNRPVCVRIFSDQDEFIRQRTLFQRLRSKYVVNLLDDFCDTDTHLFFIVHDRGGLRLDELIRTQGSIFRQNANKREEIISELAHCLLFLHSRRAHVQYQPHCFSHFGSGVRLSDVSCLGPVPSLHQVLHVSPEARDALIHGTDSVLQAKHANADGINLGFVLLELLLQNPIFAEKSAEEIYQLLNLGDQLRPYLQDSEDMEAIDLARLLAREQPLSDDEGSDLLVRATNMLQTSYEAPQSGTIPISKVIPANRQPAVMRYLPGNV